MKRNLIQVGLAVLFLVSNLGWGQPIIQFKTMTHDFGESYPNQTLTCNFELTNIGNQPLTITNVKTSCGCTAAVLSATTILSDATGLVEIKMTTSNPGNMKKTATVYSNDPKRPQVQLTVSATVKQVWAWSPSQSFYFGAVAADDNPSMELILKNTEETDFKIIECKQNRPEFKVEFGEIKNHAVPVKVSVLPTAKRVTLFDYLTIVTDNPKQPEIRIQARAEVVGDVQIQPKHLFAGNVSEGDLITREVVVKPSKKLDQPFAVTKLESKFLNLQGEIAQTNPDGSVTLKVTFTAPAKPGFFNGKLDIFTNVESEPVISLPFSAVVKKGALDR